MGQKTHPIGLRLGIHRKWNSTWYAAQADYRNIFFNQQKVEDFFKAFLHFYSYTKISSTKRVLLIDLKLFTSQTRTLYIFVFFYKFRTKKRRTLKITRKSFKNLKHKKL